MTTAGEVLAALQQRDTSQETGNVAAVMLLEQDPVLQRLVAVWPNVPTSPFPYGAACPAEIPEGRRLRWVWAILDPDPVPRWLETAGLPDAEHTRRACFIAIDNRMVHPDGSISRWATQYIRSVVRGTLARRGTRALAGDGAPPPVPPASP